MLISYSQVFPNKRSSVGQNSGSLDPSAIEMGSQMRPRPSQSCVKRPKRAVQPRCDFQERGLAQIKRLTSTMIVPGMPVANSAQIQPGHPRILMPVICLNAVSKHITTPWLMKKIMEGHGGS